MKAASAWPTGSSRSTTRALIAPSTLRSSAWAHTAPKRPVLAPTTATGLPHSGLVTSGRESQSSAFFSVPGSEWLYSGVANRTASASRIAASSSATAAGRPAASSSASYGGMALSPSQTTSSAPGGSSSAAAHRSRVLWESRRRLPEIPRTFISP